MGLLQHSSFKYPDVHDYLDRVWKPKIQSILEVDQRYTTRETNQKYSNPDYWREIGLACMTLAINFFKANQKGHLVEEVQKGRCPEKSNKIAYEAFANHLNLCLCWYECTTDRRVMTHLFHSKTKNDVSLFINIAQDGDKLYYLYHQGLNESVSIAFPYLMKVNSQGEPLSIGCELGQSEPDRDPSEALIVNLLKVVEATAMLTLAITDQIPPTASDHFRQLQERVNATKGIYSAVKFAMPPLMSDSLQALLALKVSDQPSTYAKAPHTVQNCEQYPELGAFEEYHGHRFHRECLSAYLNTLQLRYPNLPPCPVPDCQHQLPDEVLDFNPAVRSHFEANKVAVTHKTTQDRMAFFGHFSLPAQNTTLPCQACGKTLSMQYFLKHGCAVCIMCAYHSYSNIGACPLCRCPFNVDELAALTTYYNETYGQARMS